MNKRQYIDLPPDTSICPETKFTISVPDTFAHYEWNIPDVGNTPSLEVSKSGIYKLRVYKGKCSVSDSVKVHQYEPYFILGNDTTLCNGRTLTLHAHSLPGSDYQWQDGTRDSNYVVTKEGFYFVSAYNICGRFNSNINVDYIQCECHPIMPNAFTPNGDGLNDKIGPLLKCVPKKYKFAIANRWGEIVFETTDVDKKWNGTLYDEPAEMDTYFYYIETTDLLDNHNVVKGDLLLLR